MSAGLRPDLDFSMRAPARIPWHAHGGVHAQIEQAVSGGEGGRGLSPLPSGDHKMSACPSLDSSRPMRRSPDRTMGEAPRDIAGSKHGWTKSAGRRPVAGSTIGEGGEGRNNWARPLPNQPGVTRSGKKVTGSAEPWPVMSVAGRRRGGPSEEEERWGASSGDCN